MDGVEAWLWGATPHPKSGVVTESARLGWRRSGQEKLPDIRGQGRRPRQATPRPRQCLRLELFVGKFSLSLSLSLTSTFLSLSLSLAIPQFGLLSQVSSLRLPSGHSGPVLTLSNAARASLFSPRLWWLMQVSGLLLHWELQLAP